MAMNWDYFKQLFGNTPTQPTPTNQAPTIQPAASTAPQPEISWIDGYNPQAQQTNIQSQTAQTLSPPTSSPTGAPEEKAPAAPKEDLQAMFPSTGQDTEAKQAEMEREKQIRKGGKVGSFIAGIGDTLSAANQAYGVHGPTNAAEKVGEQTELKVGQERENLGRQLNDDPNSDVSKQYQAVAYKAMKMLGGNPKPEDFANISADQIKQQMPNIDKLAQMQNMKDLKEAQMEIAKTNKQLMLGMQGQKRQEDMEKQAQDRLTQIRGDQSIQKIETQRDAAIVAKNRLDELKQMNNGNYSINPVDYVDILGQVYKARTGAVPTDQMMKDIRQDTLKGDFGKWWTKFTGQQAPATTNSIGDSLEQLVTSMGKQADQLHDGYMSSRLSLPKDLEPSRGERIKKLGRGLSFADATGSNNPNMQDQSVPQVGGTYNGAKVTKVTRIK